MPARILLFFLLLAPFSALSSSDMFLKIENIKGESADKAHADDIDVLAWSWGISNSANITSGGGAAGKASFQDISITKYLDKSSPTLLLNCANGKEMGKMELFVRKNGDKPQEYLVITFEGCIVTSVSTGGSGGENRLVENVSIAFRTIKFE